MFTGEQLKEMQTASLERKIQLTQSRIIEFVNRLGIDNVYISFSGGKDSTVLAHIAQQIFPDIKMMFVNTGLEFPEIVEFVKLKIEDGWDIDMVRPEMPFNRVIDKYGYPIISKEQAMYIEQWRNAKSEHTKDIRWNGGKNGGFKISEKWKPLAKENKFKITSQCCDVMKKKPAKTYLKNTGRHPIIGTMADESQLRMQQWLKHGCNSFDGKIVSKPMSIWLESDIWEYIERYKLEIAKPYSMGYDRTGCMFCGFGCHIEEQKTGTNRFVKLEQTHPKQHKYIMEKLGFAEVLDEYGVMKNLEDKIWKEGGSLNGEEQDYYEDF